MKWGILATGTIAKKFASTVEQMGAEGEQLVAVGSRHLESAQAVSYTHLDVYKRQSVECVDRHLDPLTTNLVVADASRTEKTICLAVSPSLKAYRIPGRARLFEAGQRVKEVNAQRLQAAIRQKKAVRGEDGKYHFASTSFDANALNADPALGLSYIVAPPRMQRYLDVSTQIYKTYRCV